MLLERLRAPSAQAAARAADSGAAAIGRCRRGTPRARQSPRWQRGNVLTLIAGIGVLLLAMGVGVLIGRSGGSAPRRPPRRR